MSSRNRGKSKPTLRDLSRVPPTREERIAVRKALLDNESPIATAILGATLVEMELETELRTRFPRKDEDTWKDLTSEVGPLSTFHQKIVAAYGFRILDNVLLDSMNTVRQIRNAFAHSKRLIDFNNKLVTRELKRVTLPKGRRSILYHQFLAVRGFDEGPRKAYVLLCLALVFRLMDRRHKRSQARVTRAERNRRKALVAALRQTTSTDGTAPLGLLVGYPPVDPSQTILGSFSRVVHPPETTTPRKRNK